MKILKVFGVFILTLSLWSSVLQEIPARLKAKLDAAVSSTYEVESFELQEISKSDLELEADPKYDQLHIYKILDVDKVVGYAYLSEANSKKDVFDYVVMYDTDFSIKKSKILIYREKYGRQVGSQRWLKQFNGKKSENNLEYGEDIAAVSGATITATAMTDAIKKSLKQMAILKSKITD
ncbi:FMN-binding protein [Psychroflexus aestuariivivens]|uniref:FMN-binding protein n=1 Tax=Psychroflexus aestuariivivens TaxID=1795040 RepID=UPI000FDBC8F5|nr:FMN-binding protein [Psychroflexus aestuariivivens]